jgi:dTDP-4-dehydrorhamnose reductase
MKQIKMVVTGADGQLGRAVQDLMPRGMTGREVRFYQLMLFAHHARRYRMNYANALDVADRNAVSDAIGAAKPEIIIHASAWTDTAGCERDPERAMLVNAEGARNVAEAARDAGSAMVHLSTNEVFDGEKGSAYDEDDATNAINAYGLSKLTGEEAVRETLPEHYIVRTSWLYGRGRASFPEKVLQNARDSGRLRLVTDEVASPTLTGDLAAAIVRLIETSAYGTYHLANAGECSRKGWAEEVLRLAGVEVPIEATTQSEYGSPVHKPKLSTLANNRAAALGIALRPWRDALREHMREAAEARP